MDKFNLPLSTRTKLNVYCWKGKLYIHLNQNDPKKYITLFPSDVLTFIKRRNEIIKDMKQVNLYIKNNKAKEKMKKKKMEIEEEESSLEDFMENEIDLEMEDN
jgi:hypothetical protein